MNLVFCVDADGDGTAEAQSGDLNDVVATDGEVWISFESGEEAENALGAAVAGELILLDGQPDDYVSPDAEEETTTEEATEEATEETTEEATEEATEEVTTEEATTEIAESEDDTPKTGDAVNVTLLLVMLVSVAGYVVSKKIVID